MSEIAVLPDGEADVKSEAAVKPELEACVVCGVAASEARTPAAADEVLRQYAREELRAAPACGACLELLQLLEAARLHYVRLRDALERLLAPNPRFQVPTAPAPAPPAPPDAPAAVDLHLKEEPEDHTYGDEVDLHLDADSDNEPLLHTKRKRHHQKTSNKKKIKYSKSRKRKKSWENSEKADEFILPDANTIPLQTELKKEDNNSESQNSKLDEVVGVKNGRMTSESVRKGRGRPRKLENSTKRPGPKELHPCEHCSSKFSTLARLQQHARRHATGPFICEVCGAHYKHRRACDVHIAMHRGISDWKCAPCNKLFPSKGALQRHNNIHTGKLNYQCEECGKSFIHTSSFKMHALTHSGVKPHKCGVCGLGLLTSSHLKRHLRVHSGEKRYSCPLCGRRFSERYNLLAHSKAHGPCSPRPPPADTPDTPEAAAAPPAPPGPPAPLAHFRCGFCNERFPRKYMLERHCGAAHGRAPERTPSRPRNTMSKLLKARAAARLHAAAAEEACVKEDPSPPAPCADPPPPSVATAECATQAALGAWGLPYRN